MPQNWKLTKDTQQKKHGHQKSSASDLSNPFSSFCIQIKIFLFNKNEHIFSSWDKKGLKAAVYRTSLLSIRKSIWINLLYLQILPPGQNIQLLISFVSKMAWNKRILSDYLLLYNQWLITCPLININSWQLNRQDMKKRSKVEILYNILSWGS